MAQIWLGVRVCKIAIVASRTTGVVLLSMGNVREQLATLLQKEPTDIVNIRGTPVGSGGHCPKARFAQAIRKRAGRVKRPGERFWSFSKQQQH